MKKIALALVLVFGFNVSAFAGPNKAVARIENTVTSSNDMATHTVALSYLLNVANTIEVTVALDNTCSAQNNAIQDAVRNYINREPAVGGSQASPVNVITSRDDVRLYGACQV